MNILFFDTETTGKPVSYTAQMHELNNWPRVIQLAWQIADENGTVISSAKTLIKPDGWIVPVEDFWIQHGYSTEKCDSEGLLMAEVLAAFVENILTWDVQMIVAHNIQFDYNVLGAEMIRYKKSTGRKLRQFCTMQFGTQLCRIPGKMGFKYPRLEELYRYLFKKGFDGAHDAENDVSACRECFFEILQRGLFQLSQEAAA